MGLRLITPAAELPVSLAEAKAHLRVAHTDDDTLISSLINAATAKLDGYSGILGRCLVSQTWELSLDRFPPSEVRIPLKPLQSIAYVRYDDTDGMEQTIAEDDYDVDTTSLDGWVLPVGSWPSTYSAANAVRIAFVVGYGNAAAVPEPLKLAIKFHVQMHYDPDGERLRPVFEALIDQYVVRHV